MRVENTQTPVPDQAAMQQHVEHLFLDCMHGLVELAWADPGDGAPKHAQLFGLDCLDQLVEKAVALNGKRRNVYIGGALRKENTPRSGRSNGANFLAATALWSDLDDPGGTVRAAEAYKRLGILPTCVVITGGMPHQRAQLWWKLDEPAFEVPLVRALLGGAQVALGGDAAVVDPARLLRLGGSVAWPTKPGRVAELTRVLLFRNRPAYGVPRLAAAFPATKPAAEPGLDIGAEHQGVDVDELIAAALAGERWHDNVLRLVGHWVSRGWSDAEILLQAAALTLAGYRPEKTRAELATMIAGARERWNKPDPRHTSRAGSARTARSFWWSRYALRACSSRSAAGSSATGFPSVT